VWADLEKKSGASTKQNLSFQTETTHSCSQGSLPQLKKIEIKYVCEGFELRNYFPYMIFFKFKNDFE
jgi:hypothetical protein